MKKWPVSTIFYTFLVGIFLLFLPAQVFATVKSFSDVPPGNPYYTALQYLNGKDLQLNGYADNTFRPDQLVTRAEACLLFLISSKIEIPAIVEKNDFPDVEKGSWYHPCVQTAKDQKLIAGYPNGTFQPTNYVNNAEALAIFFNAQKVALTDTPGQWYEKYVTHAREKSVIDSNFDPATKMTRGQVINLIYKFLKQGSLARISNFYLGVQKGDCPIDPHLKEELELEIQSIPKLDAIPSTDIEKAIQLYDESHDLRDENFNNTQESIEQLKKAVALYPYFPLAWHYIAMYEINQLHNAELGMRIEQKSRLLVPDDPATTYSLHGIAVAYKKMEKISEAEVCFKESIQFMPGNHWPYWRLAQMLKEYGKYNEAVFVLDRGLEVENPGNELNETLSLEIRNTIVVDFKDYNGAEFIAKKHLKKHKDWYWFIVLLGDTYTFREKLPQQAAHYYIVAIEQLFLSNNQQKAVGEIVSQLETNTFQSDSTKLYYGDYAKSTTFFVEALNQYWKETTQAAIDEALLNITKALEINPDEPRYLLMKARILSVAPITTQTSNSEILSLLKKAKFLDPFFYDGYFLEGEVYLSEGQYEKARDAYQRVPSYHIDYLNAQQRLNSL